VFAELSGNVAPRSTSETLIFIFLQLFPRSPCPGDQGNATGCSRCSRRKQSLRYSHHRFWCPSISTLDFGEGQYPSAKIYPSSRKCMMSPRILVPLFLLMGFCDQIKADQCAQSYASEPCLPDCFNDPFGPAQTRLITIGCCLINVTYSTRIACNTWYDVYVSNIEYCDIYSSGCGGLVNLPPRILLERVAEQLLINNPMNFPPECTDRCNTNWRVSAGVCYTVCPYGNLHPCDCNICCLTAYRVCTDNCGIRSVEKLNTYPAAPCPSTKRSTDPCFPMCEQPSGPL